MEKVLGTQSGSFYLGHGLPGRVSLLIKDEAEQMNRDWELELHPTEARILGYALLMAAERERPK